MRKAILLVVLGLLIFPVWVLADDSEVIIQGPIEKPVFAENGPIEKPVRAQGPIEKPIRAQGPIEKPLGWENNADPSAPITNPGNNNGVGNPLNENPEFTDGPIEKPL